MRDEKRLGQERRNEKKVPSILAALNLDQGEIERKSECMKKRGFKSSVGPSKFGSFKVSEIFPVLVSLQL